jgi:sulfur relay protein TusB/DsrH
MLVIIKSGPDTEESARAILYARDETADIVLIRDAVYLARPERLEGFCGTAFALSEDIKLRGIKDLDKGVKEISYEELVDLIADEDKVVGAF